MINAVLLPPDDGSALADSLTQNMVEIASTNQDFSLVVQAVAVAGLVGALSGDGLFTVIAPTDAAIAALGVEALAALLVDPARNDLAKILAYHVVSGKVMADNVAPGMMQTLDSAALEITVGDDGSQRHQRRDRH